MAPRRDETVHHFPPMLAGAVRINQMILGERCVTVLAPKDV